MRLFANLFFTFLLAKGFLMSAESSSFPQEGVQETREIQELDVAEERIDPFEELVITTEEKQMIAKILTTLAENNVFQLLFEKKRLERLGQQINHVHPVLFLSTVFSDPRLVYCMHQIRRSSFKWDGFIDGFSERINEEFNRNNVHRYLPGFSARLNVKLEPIQSCVNQRNFEGLVLLLMSRPRS